MKTPSKRNLVRMIDDDRALRYTERLLDMAHTEAKIQGKPVWYFLNLVLGQLAVIYPSGGTFENVGGRWLR